MWLGLGLGLGRVLEVARAKLGERYRGRQVCEQPAQLGLAHILITALFKAFVAPAPSSVKIRRLLFS